MRDTVASTRIPTPATIPPTIAPMFCPGDVIGLPVEVGDDDGDKTTVLVIILPDSVVVKTELVSVLIVLL